MTYFWENINRRSYYPAQHLHLCGYIYLMTNEIYALKLYASTRRIKLLIKNLILKTTIYTDDGY